jgi:glutamate synthase domain-containing protein 2
MDFLHRIRGYVLPALVLISLGLALLGAVLDPAFYLGFLAMVPLLLLGVYDLQQPHHSILRNYPLLGHLRFLLEDAGPELHQYFVESNTSGRPFDRDQRSMIYRRAKDIEAVKPFGTELDVYAPGYGFISHSAKPHPMVKDPARTLRVQVGGAHCKHPYSASVLNISAMSFGALSANAIRALNTGARLGGFAHNTGEGGFSRYHRESGGDIIWQIGTGYFGCRKDDGTFDVGMFAEQASIEQVKMIELKISQGAKPGHGGILPAVKVTREIAEARKVPEGQDCFSPPGHSAFGTPIEMLEFIQTLREHASGKPVGFKICIGEPHELLAICKAILETEILPDFITVDGAEGGTGAAPQVFSDRLGFPLREGLILVHNSLIGIGLRDSVKLAASGMRMADYEIASAMALGADWCNVARGFMFSIGCIQSQGCHTNRCPVGVATQDERLQRAIVVEEKAQRAYRFHKNTVEGLAEMTAACGLDHPNEFTPTRLYERISAHQIRRFDQLYDFAKPGALLGNEVPELLRSHWESASATTFDPT